MPSILNGIRIIDFTQGYTAGYSTMLLADFGAEVIKIEKPVIGDKIRSYSPKNEKGSAYHAYINRGKKSVCLDLSTPEGIKVALKLIETADIVCENYAAGVMEELKLGYKDLIQVKPDIIYASLTGFGKTGPLSRNEGSDITSQALSGLMSFTGFPGSLPTAHGSRIADQYGGVFLAYAIMLALIFKFKTGIGQQIDISTTDCLFTALEAGEIVCAVTGKNFEREGNHSQAIAPYDTFKTLDGFISTAVSTNPQWEKFCEAMDLKELLEDPRFETNESRGKNYVTALKHIVSEKLSTMTKFDIEAILSPYNIPCGPVLTVKEAIENEHLNSRSMILEIEDKALGKIKMPGLAIKMSDSGNESVVSAPLLGEHTHYYLKDIGLARDKHQVRNDKISI